MKVILKKITEFLKKLNFKTGVIVLCFAVLFYIISFAQFLLPISVGVKGVLWVVFFGLAKTAQYSGLLIVGKEGWQRIRQYFKRRNNNNK